MLVSNSDYHAYEASYPRESMTWSYMDDQGDNCDNGINDNENVNEDYFMVELPLGKPGCCLLGSVFGAALET